MWMVTNDNGTVTVENDAGERVFIGDKRVALLGFGRALSRMAQLTNELADARKSCHTRMTHLEQHDDDCADNAEYIILTGLIATLNAAHAIAEKGGAP